MSDIFVTYCAYSVCLETQRNLVQWAKQNLPYMIKPSKLHVTTVYSRNNIFPQYKLGNKRILTTPIEFDLFGKPGAPKTLVLKLHSNHLQLKFKEALQCGATHDFPDYKPHLSLAPVDANTTKAFLNTLTLPDFPIILPQEYTRTNIKLDNSKSFEYKESELIRFV